MALGAIPPWLSISPAYFTQALEAGARTGLAVAEQTQRAQALTEARMERQAQMAQRASEQAERQREFEQSRLIDLQRLAQSAAQAQQMSEHQRAQEANQAVQESRLLDFGKARLAQEAADLKQRTAHQAAQEARIDAYNKAQLGLGERRVAATEKRADSVMDADARAIFRSLEQQLHEVERNLANPKNTLLSTSPGVKAKLDDWTRQRDDLRQRLSRINPEAYPPVPAASVVGANGRINPLPASKSELVTGTLYDTKRGVARWNGTAFEPVAVK